MIERLFLTYAPHPTASQPPAPIDSRFPLYGAKFGQAISRSFAHIFRFSGQASRSEFWWAMLFFGILRVVSYVSIIPLALVSQIALDTVGDDVYPLFIPMMAPILAFIALNTVLFFATLSIGWRRICDAGLPGALSFLSLIPLGNIAVFIMAAFPSRQTRLNEAPGTGGIAPHPVAGSRYWALGFLYFVPLLGAFLAPVLALSMAHTAKQMADPVVRENARWASNWAFTLFPFTLILICLVAVADEQGGVFPLIVGALFWICGIANAIVCTIGAAVGSRRVFRPFLAIPFLKSVD